MTSSVLDLTTMADALMRLEAEFIGDCTWRSVNPSQAEFLLWYRRHRDEVATLSGLSGLASVDYRALNDFLLERGFTPLFRPFDPKEGVGVASVLDMLVEWTTQAQLIQQSRYDIVSGKLIRYSAIELAAQDVEIYTVQGRYVQDQDGSLARLKTKSGHSLWLMMNERPRDGLQLNRIAQRALEWKLPLREQRFAGVIVPTLEMDLAADIGWMCDAEMLDSSGFTMYSITQAFQMFKLRLNEIGARVKVATGLTMRSVSLTPKPLNFDRPFIGFFTQPGHDDLPLTAFYADFDSWKQPSGSLEEL